MKIKDLPPGTLLRSKKSKILYIKLQVPAILMKDSDIGLAFSKFNEDKPYFALMIRIGPEYNGDITYMRSNAEVDRVEFDFYVDDENILSNYAPKLNP